MKIQSISDIITNSSTEVFTIYEPSNKKDIINLVNSILKLSGSNKTFDDYFEFEWLYDYDALEEMFFNEDHISDEFKEIGVFNSLDSYEEKDEYLHSIPKDDLIKYNKISNILDGFVIHSKNEKAKEVAEILNRLDDIFYTDVVYE